MACADEKAQVTCRQRAGSRSLAGAVLECLLSTAMAAFFFGGAIPAGGVAGRCDFDHAGGRIYFADDPTGRKVEATVAAFAFESLASNVLIRNVIIEKYASVAQKGAIQAQDALGWVVENCELRLNSGAGIA